jgi:hypothetical protein
MEDNCSEASSELSVQYGYYGDLILNSSRFSVGWTFDSPPEINTVYEVNDSVWWVFYQFFLNIFVSIQDVTLFNILLGVETISYIVHF